MPPAFELDSYLGTDPICDICKRPVIEGQLVLQMFIGMVASDANVELGIREETYKLVHWNCEKQHTYIGQLIIASSETKN